MSFTKVLLIPTAILMLIVGCAQQQVPTDTEPSSWQEFGMQEANKGFMKKSFDDFDGVSKDLYQSYLSGYQQGQKIYCQQDAYKLGIMGKRYTGICDELTWKFRMRYNDGRSNQSMGRL